MSFGIRRTCVMLGEAHSNGYNSFSVHHNLFLPRGTRQFIFPKPLLLIQNFEKSLHLNSRFSCTIAAVDCKKALIWRLVWFHVYHYKKAKFGPFLLLYALWLLWKLEQKLPSTQISQTPQTPLFTHFLINSSPYPSFSSLLWTPFGLFRCSV